MRLIFLLWRLMLVFKTPLKSRQDLRANLALDDKDAHLLGADSMALLANTVKSSHLYIQQYWHFNILISAARDDHLLRPYITLSQSLRKCVQWHSICAFLGMFDRDITRLIFEMAYAFSGYKHCGEISILRETHHKTEL